MVSGLDINLTEFPEQNFVPAPLTFSAEESAATDQLIQELLHRNAIVPCVREDGNFISTIFLRRKPNGSYRMILNLKNFNKYVEYCKFKMDTLLKILTLVTHHCFMGSIDLLDAYFSLFVALFYQKFLKF